MKGTEEQGIIFGSKSAEPTISDRGFCGGGQLGEMGRDMKPLYLKVGLALAISASGFVIFQICSSRRRRSPAISGSRSPETLKKKKGEDANPREIESSNAANAAISLKDDFLVFRRSEEVSSSITSPPATSVSMIDSLSPNEEKSFEEEGFLLPEFKHLLVKESYMITENNPVKPTKEEEERESALKKEIETLREVLETYEERVKQMESQLVEYYELKNQEAAIGELENRLKIAAMESHLLSLKIESLLAENCDLHARLLEYSNMLSELEGAKNRFEILAVKMKSDAEEAATKLSVLHQSIEAMMEKEKKEMEAEVELEKRIKALEVERDELKCANLRLVQENSELSKRWEELENSMKKTVIPSDHVDQKIFEQGEVSESQSDELMWGEENYGLKQEIEQLKMDRCADAEELVYLKWINACLRYELHNHKPLAPGEMTARDLSKNLSPKSETKAKQLILEYANDCDARDASSRSSFRDLHQLDCCSSQGSSSLEELGYVETEKKKKESSGWRKIRFLNKFRRLVVGKKEKNKICMGDEVSNSEIASSCVTTAVDLNGFGAISFEGSKHHIKCLSDVGEKSHIFRRRMINQEEEEEEDKESSVDEEKARVKKYAEALSNRSGMNPRHSRRRAVSLSFW